MILGSHWLLGAYVSETTPPLWASVTRVRGHGLSQYPQLTGGCPHTRSCQVVPELVRGCCLALVLSITSVAQGVVVIVLDTQDTCISYLFVTCCRVNWCLKVR